MKYAMLMVVGTALMGMGSVSWAGESCGSCGMKEAAATTQPADASAKYVCPMNCPGSASDKPGNCSKCGMKLVEQKPAAQKPHAGHQH